MKLLIHLLLIVMLFFGIFSLNNSVIANEHGENDNDEDNDDDEHDKDDENVKNAYERELEITKEAKKFEISSELAIGENKDKIEIEFKVDDKAELEFEYKIETESAESELEFEVEFREIVEYLDAGIIGNGYQKGEEVFEYDFDGASWDPIQYNTETVDGAIVNVISAQTSDGVFTLVMKIAESLLDLESGVTLAPNTLKIDVEIHDFPYTANGSSLAIKTKLKSETEYEVEDDTLEEGTGFAFNESQVSIGLGFFSWAESAIVDSKQVAVISSPLEVTTEEEQDEDKLETEIEQKIFFSFNATDAKDIVWDPKVGVLSSGTQKALANLLGETDGTLPGFQIWPTLVTFAFFVLLGASRRKIIHR